MAGLLGFALAGALGGAGQGIVQQAQQQREMFLEDLRHQRRQDERMQDRQWHVEDRDLMLAARRSGGSGGGGRAARPVQITSGMQSRIERRFRDATTGDINWSNVDMITGEMERLMAERSVTETEAFRIATGTARMSETEVPPGLFDRLRGREPTRRAGTDIVGFEDRRPPPTGDDDDDGPSIDDLIRRYSR